MEKLTTLTGVAVPLRRSNVDTDQIIPAVFLKRVKKSGFDDALFYAWRRDPEFVLNKPEYKQGKILVAGPDFGIGSSREHAVWALHDYGFRVVISSRFADIFYGNTAKNSVLAAIMPQESIELLWKLLDEEPGRLRRHRPDAAARRRHHRIREDARRKVPVQAEDPAGQARAGTADRIRP